MGTPFERKVLLGEEVACEHEAGDEKGKVFFHRMGGIISLFNILWLYRWLLFESAIIISFYSFC